MEHVSIGLDARSLSFVYGGAEVVRDASVRVTSGEITAITGPNGSGKSTLLELLAGVRSPQRGTVDRRGDLALVVQHPAAPAALPLTARDAVAVGTWRRGHRMSRATRRDAVERALHRVGMAHAAVRPVADLSGGQRQRVFLAQGIVGSPDILLLDEPAAGLDEESVGRIRGILREEACRGVAVCCVTHDPHAVAEADRVLRLEEGRVTADH